MSDTTQRISGTSSTSLSPRPCRVCKMLFKPRSKDQRIAYCSKRCSARAMQMRRYGLEVEEFDQMVLDQNFRCAICLKPPAGRGWHIDHNHQTGQVRGLLCDGCNPGLGNFREDPDALRRAAEYLERTNG